MLVSVRSGAAVSMPGMMDTILNVGLDDAAAAGLAAAGNARFANDSYRRLIQMYGETVDGVDPHRFEQELARLKAERGVSQDVELTAEDLATLVDTFREIYEQDVGAAFPQDANAQLIRAVVAVFESWETPRAQVYRRAHDIPDDLGTAVNIVQMVFGNKGERSGTGVAFTRNPSTGEAVPFGEFLVDAQGEDVVAGIRTPEPLALMAERLPAAYSELLETMARLEAHYRDMQDIEFTVEDDRLYILQTRTAKRTAAAALKAAVDMVAEGVITREEAVARIDPAQLDQLLHPMIDPETPVEVIATGLNASPGAASGRIVLDAGRAEELGKAGEAVILVRWETTPDDIHGLLHAKGVLTAHGGMTSHAAVVARGMGKPCVAGCEGLAIDAEAGVAHINGHELAEGDLLTIDGGTGRVILGQVPLVPPHINEDFETVLEWADGFRRLAVRANADTPEDAAKARELGAEGIGLCRTEHMFMVEERLPVMREMILADSTEGRRSALERILPMQQADFEGIFRAMAGVPVTIRLLDPPLHEFLPPLEEAVDEHMRERIRVLQEANPMLGMRGCRVGLIFPEIYEMQVRAIVRAARAVHAASGEAPLVEIMHPLVGFGEELRRLRELTDRVAAEEDALEYAVGTMIELPRACVRADEVAEHADFFSFGTNDLTQTALGFSRDDAESKFLARYLEDDVLEQQPVRDARRGRCRRSHAHRRRARPRREARPQARDLRRARGRPALGVVLPRDRARLRVLLAVPRAARPARRSAGGARRGGRDGGGRRRLDAVESSSACASGCRSRFRSSALLGASSAQGVPAAGPGYVASFQIAYDSPPFPDTRYRVTVSFTGDVCGDPFDDPWGFEATRTGGPSTPPPTLSPVTFAAANPINVTGDRLDRCERRRDRPDRLHPPLQRRARRRRSRRRGETTGDIVNVVATPTVVPVTARTIAECPAAQPPPPPLEHCLRARRRAPCSSTAGGIAPDGPIPYGSRVNVTDGRLILKTELGTVTVYGGGVPAVFRLVRLREPSDLVGMRLVEGNFKTCGKRTLAGAGQAMKPVRRLWAKGSGKFQTMGRYATATARGTWWLTADLCDQTVVRAREGSVLVTDFVTKKKVVVKAPKSYTARRKAR